MDKDNAQIVADEMSADHKLFGRAITYKLLLIVFFVSLFILLIGMTGAEALRRVWQASHSFATTDVPVISNLYTIEESTTKQIYFLERLSEADSTSVKNQENLSKEFAKYTTTTTVSFENIRNLLVSDEEKDLYSKALKEYIVFTDQAQYILSEKKGQATAEEIHSYLSKSNTARRSMQDYLFSLAHISKKRIAENASALADTHSNMRQDLLYISLAGLLFACLAGILLGRKVVVAPALSVEKHAEELSVLNKELNTSNKQLVEQEIQLSETNQRLRTLDAVRTEFVSIVAHQLRTPLAGIKWTLDMLINGDMGEMTIDQKSHLMKIIDTNERMIRFVTDLLSISRIESGRLEYNFVPVNLQHIAESVLLDIYPLSNHKQVFVTFRGKGITLPTVAADTEKIRAVFQNLLENSIKYTPSGGHVTLDIRNKGGEVLVSVSDDGSGIPKDEQRNIFKQFYRAPSAVKMQAEGSGLGLYLAKAIVEGHGGKIWFESEKGKGTTFYFTIPVPRKS